MVRCYTKERMMTRYAQHDLTWVDLVSPSGAEVRAVMKEFNLDPLIAEELLAPSFKPKVERRGDAVYVILHFPALRTMSSRPEQEIDFIVGKHFLITTRYETIDPLHSFARSFEVQTVLGRGGSSHGGHLFVALVRSLYQALGDECAEVRRALQTIEDQIFKGDERGMVVELSHVGRTIHDFRQALQPHQEMLGSLEPAAGRFFGVEFGYYVRELVGAYERVEATLSNLHDSLSELRATNDSLLNTKQNEIMKNFTVLTFVFLPLSFIAGLFGMNTVHNPIIGSGYDFWILCGIMLFVAVSCFVYFRHKGWL